MPNSKSYKSVENIMRKVKTFGELLINAGRNFSEDRCMKMSASLAYYTVFSIGPLIFIVIWFLGFIYGNHIEDPDAAKAIVMNELSKVVGVEIAELLTKTIQHISIEKKSHIGLLIGIITLIITSTTIFIDIQSSINSIWRIKVKPKKNWLKMLINRLVSFTMVIGLSFLLMASLLISSTIGIITKYIDDFFQRWNFENLYIEIWTLINAGVTFLIITSLFGFIFAFLPDAKIRFKDIFGGAVFTATLFMIGKYGISFYLSSNATASAYGAAGSLILLLAWVYYSASILYFGAQFTKEYAKKYGIGITPSPYAVLISESELIPIPK